MKTVGRATRTCVNEDVSLQVVSAPKSSVTVITNKVFLHFGRWTVLISCALVRTVKSITLILVLIINLTK